MKPCGVEQRTRGRNVAHKNWQLGASEHHTFRPLSNEPYNDVSDRGARCRGEYSARHLAEDKLVQDGAVLIRWCLHFETEALPQALFDEIAFHRLARSDQADCRQLGQTYCPASGISDVKDWHLKPCSEIVSAFVRRV